MTPDTATIILENELKDKIAKGNRYRLILKYMPNLNQFLLYVKGNRKVYELHTARGGSRVMRDPRRAIDWARSIGLSGVDLNCDFD